MTDSAADRLRALCNDHPVGECITMLEALPELEALARAAERLEREYHENAEVAAALDALNEKLEATT